MSNTAQLLFLERAVPPDISGSDKVVAPKAAGPFLEGEGEAWAWILAEHMWHFLRLWPLTLPPQLPHTPAHFGVRIQRSRLSTVHPGRRGPWVWK